MDRALLQRLLQPSVVIAASVCIAVVSVAVAVVVVNTKPSATFVEATEGPLTEEVSATGTIKPAESVDLSFDTSGTIARVYADVGMHVAAGQTLAALSGADLSAALEQAEANLAIQKAKLAGLEAGATPASRAAAQTAVSNAQNALVETANDAYVKADDAIHNRVDQILQNGGSSAPTLSLALSDSQAAQNIVSGRISMEKLLTAWQAYLASLPSDTGTLDADSLGKTTAQNLHEVGAYLDTVAAGLTSAVPSSAYSLSTIQGFQSSISTARTNITADMSSLAAARSALATAKAALDVTLAPASQSDLDADGAEVASAQAQVDVAKANLAKTVITAPIAGTITVNNAHVGATAAPGASVFSMNSNSRFEIEAFVSELDYAKIKRGDSASVSLDAHPDTAPLFAHVIQVDPAATILNGVAAYKITLQFDADDARETAGLTANVKITTASIAEALSVPTSAVITQGDKKFVMKEVGQGQVLTPVTIGITGDNGFTEITSGLSSGDRVRAFGSQQ